MRKLLGVIDKFIILIVEAKIKSLWRLFGSVYIYIQTHDIVHFKYVQFIIYLWVIPQSCGEKNEWEGRKKK